MPVLPYDVGELSLVIRKPAICICENKDADQLRGNRNREADQRLYFRNTDSTIPLLPKSKISSLQPSSVTVQPVLCRTWSETPKTGILTTRLNYRCKGSYLAMVHVYKIHQKRIQLKVFQTKYMWALSFTHT